jgi:hypothetical protein
MIDKNEEEKIRNNERRNLAKEKLKTEIRKDERARALYEGLSDAERHAIAVEEEVKESEKREKKRTADSGFAKVYDAGFSRIRALIADNRAAALLYTFLAENTDAATGTVVASQEVLSDEIGISRTSIWRASKYLEDKSAIVRIKVGGGVYAYALHPDEIWRAWKDNKKNATFFTKTLVRKQDRENNNIKRKVSMMMKELGSDRS